MLAGCQPVAHLSRHRHVVTGLTFPFTDDHLEIHRVAFGNAPDLDHVDLLGQSRCNFEMEGTPQSLLPRRNLAGDDPSSARPSEQFCTDCGDPLGATCATTE